MPKRSNDFQRLVKHIYSQLAPEGASVQESVFLKERSSTSTREIDILIECVLAGHKLRMAIECRDRSRKSDIAWIDELIGKYDDLDIEINKKVAVSRSDFSKLAKEKALAKNIETMTLARALTLNWPQEFIKLRMIGFVLNTQVKRVRIEATPGLTEKASESDIVVDNTRKAIATIGEMANDYFHAKGNDRIREYLNQHFAELFHTLPDFHKLLKVEQSFSTSPPIYLIDPNGISHRIQSMTLTTISKFSVEQIPVEHYVFGEGKALVTTGMLDFADSNKSHTVNVIQIPGKEQMVVSIKSAKKKKTRT